MDGQQRIIERYLEYITIDSEVYYAKIVRYVQLGFVYVWYEFHGNFQESRQEVYQ